MSLGRASVALLFAGVLAMGACAEIAGIESWAPEGASSTSGGSTSNGVSSTTATGGASSSSGSGGGGGVGTGGGGGRGGIGGSGGASTSTSASTGSGGSGGQVNLCGDGKQNGLETDIDCGGPMCGKCDPGLKCLDSPDCTSNCCKNGRCCFGCVQMCNNYCQDGDETDVDCGGDNCGLTCTTGQKCNSNLDCITGLTCQSMVCGP